MEIFTKLEPKDKLTLSVSFAAFMIALFGFFQKSAEKKIGIRKQLTDTIMKLLELNVEAFKANDDKAKGNYPNEYGRLIGDQRRLIVRQAKYLSEMIPREVSPYESVVIAIAFDDIDDPPQAEILFKHALDRSMGEFERVITHRQYARFRFNQRRPEEGRALYEKASNLLNGVSDKHLMYQGDTFERWARAEKDHGDRSRFDGLVKRAGEEYKQNCNGWEQAAPTKQIGEPPRSIRGGAEGNRLGNSTNLGRSITSCARQTSW